MTEYLVRAAALEGFTRLVEELGQQPRALLAQAGLPTELDDPDLWISYRAFLTLLELSAERTACPHFGLLLSGYQSIDMLGTVGFIMREAPDVRTALVELRRYFAHHNQGGEIRLSVAGDTAMLSWETRLFGFPMQQQTDLVAGVGQNIMRMLCGQQWCATSVHLPHASPADRAPYERAFRCPVVFDSESSLVSFDAATLDLPIGQANSQLHRILERHIGLVQDSYPDDFPAQIRHLIRQAIMTGDCSIERVSDYLSVNKRTVQRQLKADGISYKDLLEEVRFDIATRYLRESRSSLTTLASMLCYSELSAFSNAFKKRHGISPREWKRQHGC